MFVKRGRGGAKSVFADLLRQALIPYTADYLFYRKIKADIALKNSLSYLHC
jgi:hypothetical protein